jgi:hypothetical protein
LPAHAISNRIRNWLPRGQPLPEEAWNTRHRGFIVLLWAHAVGLVIFGIVRGYGVTHSILESGIVAVAALGASLAGGRATRSIIATLGLLSSSGILVHMSGGTIEAHFHFFVMVTLITLYQSWVPFLLSIAYVVIHHGVMGSLDPGSVYNHAAAVDSPFKWAFIHGVFILAASIAGLIVWKRNEDLRLKEHAQALELNDTVVQGLVAAKMAVELDLPTAKTTELLDATLLQAQGIVSKILRDTSGQRPWHPGDFVREEDAALLQEEATQGAGP